MLSWSFSEPANEEINKMNFGTSSALTVESVRLALGASTLRQQVIADNIANVNSPDHVRMRVVFEDQLAAAIASAKSVGEHDIGVTLGAVEPTLESMPVTDGKVALDEEVALMSENSLRYHALTRGLSRYFSILSAIASGGRG